MVIVDIESRRSLSIMDIFTHTHTHYSEKYACLLVYCVWMMVGHYASSAEKTLCKFELTFAMNSTEKHKPHKKQQ